MTKVKICGITNENDARHAVLSGADYLGFIFYPPSPRAANVDIVRTLVRRLREDNETGPLMDGDSRLQLVGVFVNETAEVMSAVLAACGLDLAQLSGEESPELAKNPNSDLMGRVYQAVRLQSVEQARQATADVTSLTPDYAPTLLLDAYHPSLRGGTGQTADWQLAAELVHLTPRLMLAGGLNPDNVADAVRRVRPFAVDVASGVEAAPGFKDPDKVRQFIEAVRKAG